jgi:hypothetical protein
MGLAILYYLAKAREESLLKIAVEGYHASRANFHGSVKD